MIGGYIPNGNVLDSVLVGYFDGRDLMYAASVRAGIPSEFRRVLVPHFEHWGHLVVRSPPAKIPESHWLIAYVPLPVSVTPYALVES